VVPAALAVGEHFEISGAHLLRAIALGYDIGSRFWITLRTAAPQTFKSSHSLAGIWGAAAAAGSAASLNAQQMRWLIDYTAQQASGVASWSRDSEHIEKGFTFGGMPARSGTTSALLVNAGWTGVDDVLSGENNYLLANAPQADPAKLPAELLIEQLGQRYEIAKTNLKKWSVGSPIQAPLDSLRDLLGEHRFNPDDVEKVVVRVSHQGANTVDNRDMADICMQHMCAVMLLDGTVTFASSHDQKRMRGRAVLALRQRIELRGDDALTAAMPSRQGIVEITLRDGRKLSHHTQAVRGAAENPMTRAEVDEKSFDLIAPVTGKARARKLCEAIWRLEKLADLRSLRPLLRA
jgi:2-methylcitrate dehydratase PrpD